jgi:hypothetical protein
MTASFHILFNLLLTDRPPLVLQTNSKLSSFQAENLRGKPPRGFTPVLLFSTFTIITPTFDAHTSFIRSFFAVHMNVKK